MFVSWTCAEHDYESMSDLSIILLIARALSFEELVIWTPVFVRIAEVERTRSQPCKHATFYFPCEIEKHGNHYPVAFSMAQGSKKASPS